MSHVFDLTNKVQIVVQFTTHTGSAFGVTPKGDQVFLNQRMVSRMNVQAGDMYAAFLLPNYKDKADNVPWRALRIEPIQVDLDLDHVSKDAPENFPNSVPRKLSSDEEDLLNIIGYMTVYDNDAWWTTSELADAVGLPFAAVDRLCRNDEHFYRQDAISLRSDDI
jgi:hypothetical protein